MERASTSGGGKEFTITVLFPDVSEAIAHITVEQEQLSEFVQEAEELRDKAAAMYDKAREIAGQRQEMSDLLETFLKARDKYQLPLRRRPTTPESEDIPTQKTSTTKSGVKKVSEKTRGKPKIVSMEKVSAEQATTFKHQLRSSKRYKDKPTTQPPPVRTPLRISEVYTDSEDDDVQVSMSKTKTSVSKSVQPPISKYVSSGISKIIEHQSRASTPGQEDSTYQQLTTEEQIVAWNRRLANIYGKPDPRLPLQIFLPQAGAHRAKSDPLYGKHEQSELKSWVEWNGENPILNVERYRDDGGRYTDNDDPKRQLTVDKRLIMPATWRKHHKRLEIAITMLETKLRMNQPRVELENIDNSIQELFDTTYHSEVTAEDNLSQPAKLDTQKRRHISSDEKDEVDPAVEIAEIDKMLEPSNRIANPSRSPSQR